MSSIYTLTNEGNFIIDNANTHIINLNPPYQGAVTITDETVKRVTDFLRDHADKWLEVSEKINNAIIDILDQEEYEIGIAEYWRSRRA